MDPDFSKRINVTPTKSRIRTPIKSPLKSPVHHSLRFAKKIRQETVISLNAYIGSSTSLLSLKIKRFHYEHLYRSYRLKCSLQLQYMGFKWFSSSFKVIAIKVLRPGVGSFTNWSLWYNNSNQMLRYSPFRSPHSTPSKSPARDLYGDRWIGMRPASGTARARLDFTDVESSPSAKSKNKERAYFLPIPQKLTQIRIRHNNQCLWVLNITLY